MLQLSKIADLDIQLIDGDRGENYPSRDEFYENEYCLFLDANNITSNGFDFSTTHFITKEKDSKLRNGKLQRNDIVIMTRGSVGNIAFYDNSIMYSNIRINSGMLIIRCGKSISPLNVYYQFKSPIVLKQINDFMSGSVQKQLPVSILKEIKIFTCSKNNANFLKLIDDKIALNNKTNTELENMAKTIYDYWFSQFDFPDKNSHPYKTSGGQMVYNEILKREIPAGWEVKRLGDVCEIVLGGTPSTDKDEYWNGNIPWLNSGEVAEFPIINAEKTVTELGIKDSATELVPAGTVTLSITRHLRPSILTMDACINQSVVGIKENDIFSKNFLYPFIASKINHYMMLRTGAQQPHINKETVDDTLVCIPSTVVLENYNKEVGSIYERIILNAKETKQLTMLRDYLLPLLMNGQIEVK